MADTIGITQQDVTNFTQLWKSWDVLSDKNGKRHTVFWVNGNQYIGEWRNNRKEGTGEMTCTSKKLKYDGDFKDGKRQGQGILWKIMPNDKLVKIYDGDWVADKKEGEGVMYFKNGNVYSGEWQNNKMSGMGKLAYANDDYFEGNFEDNQRSGFGKLTYANGDIYEGNWVRDQKEGPGVYYYVKQGKMYTGEWRDGVAKCGEMVDARHESSMPECEVQNPMDIIASQINRLRIDRAAKQNYKKAFDDEELAAAFTQEQRVSLKKGFDMVSQGVNKSKLIEASQLGEVFAQFGAGNMGRQECQALLESTSKAEEDYLNFEDFLRCMYLLINA